MKSQKKKHPIIKIIAITLIACVVFCGIFAGANAAAKSIFWNSSDSEISMSDKYADEIYSATQEAKEQTDTFLAILDQANVFDSELEALAEKYNGYIETYFEEVYGIDVSSIIDEIQSFTLDFSDAQTELEDGTVIAYTNPATKCIYLNENYFDFDGDWFTEEDFYLNYVHEVMHALGIDDEDDWEMMYVTEGMAEYLTGQILTYCGADYYNYTTYTYNTDIAGQLIEADKNLVAEMVGNYGEFDIKEYIDERTDCYASELAGDLMLVIYSGSNNKNLLLRVQYIAAVFCKNTAPDEAKEIVGDSCVIRFFELRALLHGYK